MVESNDFSIKMFHRNIYTNPDGTFTFRNELNRRDVIITLSKLIHGALECDRFIKETNINILIYPMYTRDVSPASAIELEVYSELGQIKWALEFPSMSHPTNTRHIEGTLLLVSQLQDEPKSNVANLITQGIEDMYITHLQIVMSYLETSVVEELEQYIASKKVRKHV